jgi:hypothetical protein
VLVRQHLRREIVPQNNLPLLAERGEGRGEEKNYFFRQPCTMLLMAAITFVKLVTVVVGKSEIFFFAKSSMMRFATRPLLNSVIADF